MKAAYWFGVSLVGLALSAGMATAQPEAGRSRDGEKTTPAPGLTGDAEVLIPYGAGYEARFGKERASDRGGDKGGNGSGGSDGGGGGGNGGGNGR